MGSRPSTTALRSSVPPVSHHDIPPDIVIDVGSFSIETNREITDVQASNSTDVGTYKGPNGKSVRMALIKIIRMDDGAVLYQNFKAEDATIEFATTTSEGSRKITIKPGMQGDNQNINFDSRAGKLRVEKIKQHGRIQKLNNGDLKIMNVKVKNDGGTLFSQDILYDGDNVIDQYRVIIIVEY